MFFNFNIYKLFYFVLFFLNMLFHRYLKENMLFFLKKINIPGPSRLRGYILIAFNNAEYSYYLFLRLFKKRF